MGVNRLLYSHVRLDTGVIFYIGVGDVKRSRTKHHRNPHWHNIVNKASYKVVLLQGGLSQEQAFLLEVDFIRILGRADQGTGLLCNMTDGGEGGTGGKRTPAQCKKISDALMGRPLSESHKASLRGPRPNAKPHARKKVINTLTGEIHVSMVQAARSVHMKPTTLAAQLRGDNKNKTDFRIL